MPSRRRRAHGRGQLGRGAAALVLAGLIATIAGCAHYVTTQYQGTYTRTWVDADGTALQQSGPVTLILRDDGHYWIEGDRFDLPPKRSGSFFRDGEEIVLHDMTPATAGYSLSLVLDGSFRLAEDETGLVLSQEDPWGHSHLLILEKAR